MSAETGRHRRLEIAHVLFVDIVGYSKLLLNEQSEILDELNEVVRSAEQVRVAQDAGALLRLPTGDGVALIFRGSPEAPAQCALEVARILKSHPKLQLRMGIHSGPVNEVTSADDRANIAGAGINIAQRVMDCGDAGHILLSKRVAQDLESHEGWRPYLHDLGEVTVKHGVSIHIVNLYTDDLGEAQVPAKIERERDAKAILARRARSKRRNALILGTLIALAAIGLGFFLLRDRLLRRPIETQMDAKGIAVLPFENFSDDKENAFFADGIQDDILTSLAKIKDLRVISRSSVMGFRDAGAQNVRHIGRKLDVANVLEGSVRKEGDRVVVNVQLIDTRNNRQIWANRYDRTLVDSLGLQGELANEIADKLRAALSDDEKALAAAKPTRNPDAYVFYLRANQISRNPDTLLEDYKTAERLYMQAIELDPNFALAHARLASVCAEVFRYYEPTDSWRTKARAEAEAALRLQPNLAEGHFALGQCIYWMDQDYDKALEQFEIASRLSPSNADTRRLIAAIERRQGKWQAALEAYRPGAKLDPQNPSTARELMYTNTSMRRWPEAARWVEQMRALAPTSLVAKIQSGYINFQWKGDTRLLKSMLEEIPAGVDPEGSITAARWDVAMLQRDYSAAKKVLETSSANETSYSMAGLTPKIFLEGCTYVAQGDNASAQKAFEQARPVFEAAVKEAPESAERHASLGWLYALMGRKNDAIAEGQRAVELKPASKDAVDGSLMSGYLALIYARVGEKDLAIPLIERLLKTPGAVDSADYSITVNDLKYRWEWDPLRNDPRFQKLITQSAP